MEKVKYMGDVPNNIIREYDSEFAVGSQCAKLNDLLPHEVASGLYFCRLQVGDFEKTVKIVLVR
jgi:hypothetical protein